MAFRVPEWQVDYVKEFLELPDDKVDGFLTALDRAGPQFNSDDLAERLSRDLKLPRGLTHGITRGLLSIYLTRENQPIEEFLDKDVFLSLKRAEVFSEEKTNEQWKKLRSFLITALSLESTIGATAKAGPVLTQHERIFIGARIMTDLRPIYRADLSEKPDAALIVHMLKVSQRDYYGQKKDLYFALDSNDIALMKEVIERAEKKEETLKRIMKDSGVVILHPKGSY
jgi:hypothetical protein